MPNDMCIKHRNESATHVCHICGARFCEKCAWLETNKAAAAAGMQQGANSGGLMEAMFKSIVMGLAESFKEPKCPTPGCNGVRLTKLAG
jgi:hypothetical protein